MLRPLVPICAALLAALASPAQALCSGAGLEQEWREADVVVRARLVAETLIQDDAPSPALVARWGEYFPVQLYRLRVLERFKGAPGPTLNLFQEVTSGRFPIDMDRDYLLFLNYIRPHRGRPVAARGAMYVHYACGQSKRWSEVAAPVRLRLARLAGRR